MLPLVTADSSRALEVRTRNNLPRTPVAKSLRGPLGPGGTRRRQRRSTSRIVTSRASRVGTRGTGRGRIVAKSEHRLAFLDMSSHEMLIATVYEGRWATLYAGSMPRHCCHSWPIYLSLIGHRDLLTPRVGCESATEDTGGIATCVEVGCWRPNESSLTIPPGPSRHRSTP